MVKLINRKNTTMFGDWIMATMRRKRLAKIVLTGNICISLTFIQTKKIEIA